MSSILVCCRDKKRAAQHYVPALKAAGWKGPIQLCGTDDPVPSFEGIAGLLLTGGADIDPAHWDPADGWYVSVPDGTLPANSITRRPTGARALG